MRNAPVPKISIVTPSYNAEVLIGSTIESVIRQTFQDWEMLVVDDCSRDGTRDVVSECSEKDSRIRLIPLPENFGGPAAPRNVGVREAKGQYVAFLDADDIWHPNKLALQLQLIEKHGADFVCSEMADFVDDEEILFPEFFESDFREVNFLQQSIRNRIPTSSVLASRELLLSIPFEESIRYRAVEDNHCWLRILESGTPCLKLKLPLLHYRKVEGQISGSKVEMAKKVFMMHREYPGRSILAAMLMAGTHVLGALYVRILKKGM